jgi:hypothetical protein
MSETTAANGDDSIVTRWAQGRICEQRTLQSKTAVRPSHEPQKAQEEARRPGELLCYYTSYRLERRTNRVTGALCCLELSFT